MSVSKPNVFSRSLVAALLLIALGAPADHPLRADLLETVLAHEAEREGDYDRLVQAWLELAPRSADDPRIELVFRRLRTVVPRLANPEAIREPLAKLLDADQLRGPSREIALDLVAWLESRRGEFDAAFDCVRRQGYTTSFLVAGPFGLADGADLRREYGPELAPSALGGSYRDSGREIAFKIATTPHPQALIDPRAHAYPRRGIFYVLAQLEAAETFSARLTITGGQSVRAWLNGQEIIDDTQRLEYRPSERSFDVELAAGWNHLLVKTRGPIGVRWSDLDGRPLGAERLRTETSDTIHDLAAGAASLAPPRRAQTNLDRWIESVDGLEAPEGPDATRTRSLEELGIGVVERERGRGDLALARVEKAIGLAPDDPYVLNQSARTFRDADYLPASVRRNRSEALWRHAVEVDPDFLPAHIYLARYLAGDDKETEAARKLEDVLEDRPSCLYALRELHGLYQRLDWETEARRVRAAIRVVAPGDPEAPRLEAERYRKLGNADRARELYEESLALDPSQLGVLAILASLASSRGEDDAAEAFLRKRVDLASDRDGALADLARHLSRAGRHDEAIAIHRERAREDLSSPDPWIDLADALVAAGKDEEAREAARRALEREPGDLRLRRWLAKESSTQGELLAADNFWGPYDERLEDWIDRVPASGPLIEKAGAICVLDLGVIKVWPDGSSRSYTHQAFRLLSEEHKDAIARVQTPGEVIALRTVTPDGESLEPVAALGRREYVMPGIRPGAFTEYAYVTESARAGTGQFEASPFYFQDYNFAQSVLLSRYVILLPDGISADVVEKHLRSQDGSSELATVDARVTELPDGYRAFIWETREARRLERESLMPSHDDYLPSVSIAAPSNWEDVVLGLKRWTDTLDTRATPELRRLVDEATQGLESPLEKTRALHRLVNELVPGPGSSSSAVEVYYEKAGDRTLLLKALLDIANVPASWAWMRQAEDMLPETDWSHPDARLFPSRVIAVEPDSDSPVWIDLTVRNWPIGRLPDYWSGGAAMVLAPGGERLIRLPATRAEDYATTVDATYRLGDGLAADIDLRMIVGSIEGWAQKDRFRDTRTHQKELMGSAMASNLYPGARVRSLEFLGLDVTEEPFGLALDLNAPHLLRRAGDEALLPVVHQASYLVRSYGGAAERRHPIHLRRARAVRAKIRVELGEHWEIERVPSNTALACPLGLYSLRFSKEEGVITIEQALTLEPGRLEASEFSIFLDFAKAVDEAEKGSIVLRKKAGA